MDNVNMWFGAGTFLMFLVEVVAGRHRGVHDRSSIIVTILCALGSNVVTRPLSALMIGAVLSFALPAYRGALAGLPVIPTYIGLLVLGEFCFYWGHRWAHEAKGTRWEPFWKLHRTHHSGKFMNTTLLVRVNLFWYFVVPNAWVFGSAIYLGMGKASALALLTLQLWNVVTHSNFRWDDPVRRHRIAGPLFRALEHVIVSPGIHHSHHGYGKDGGNFRNYGVVLSVFDWMFGTLHIPEGRPWRYGLPGPNAHWAEEVFYPLVRVRATPQTASFPQDRIDSEAA